MLRRDHRKLYIPGLLIGALMFAGCATRGYVRDTVGASEETLSARIGENETDIAEAREGIDTLNARTQEQAQQIQQANNRLDETRTEFSGEISETRDVATNALETAESANERAEDAIRRFGERNRLEVRSTHEVHFGFDSAELSAEQTAQLEGVAEVISQNPDVVIVLEGHTDPIGAEEYNLRLAERRVDAVKRHLVTELSVPVYRIHEFAYGESKLLHEGEEREQRAMNRAVNIVVLGPAGGAVTTSSSSASPE